MSEDQPDYYMFDCKGNPSRTTEGAWDSFRKTAEVHFRWVKGFKYWRRIPAVLSIDDREMGCVWYTVEAVAYAMEEEDANGHAPAELTAYAEKVG